MIRTGVRCAAFFALLLPWPAARADDALPRELMEQIKGATVFVKTKFGPLELVGSGFVIQMDGDTAHIVTNRHVVVKPKVLALGGHIRGLHGRDKMYLRKLQRDLARTPTVVSVVVNSGGGGGEQVLKAEVAAAMDDPDLAILKVRGIKQSVQPISVQDAPTISETMPVYICGFPFGEALSVDKGHPAITVGKGAISSIRKNSAGEIVKVQIDGSLNPGNSGGPILDHKGNLVGVAVQTIQGSNIGLAIYPGELTQMLQGRLGRAAFVAQPVPNKRTYDLVVPLVDPLQKIKSVTAYCVEGNHPFDAAKGNEPQLESNPQSLKYELAVKDRMARYALPPLDNATQNQLEMTVQLANVDQAGKRVYCTPVVLKTPLPTAAKPEDDAADATETTPGEDPAPVESKTEVTQKGNSTTVTRTEKTANGTSKRQVTVTRGKTPPAKANAKAKGKEEGKSFSQESSLAKQEKEAKSEEADDADGATTASTASAGESEAKDAADSTPAKGADESTPKAGAGSKKGSAKSAGGKELASAAKVDAKASTNDLDAKPGKETKIVWTNNIKRMKIPDADVTGMLDGVEFAPDSVELKGNRLIFRQGTDFFADREVSLVLWKKKEEVSGKKAIVNGKVRSGDPHASFSVKREGDKLPKTQQFLEYMMVLEFGDYDPDTRSIPGKFYICFPDKAKSFCAGTFDARAN